MCSGGELAIFDEQHKGYPRMMRCICHRVCLMPLRCQLNGLSWNFKSNVRMPWITYNRIVTNKQVTHTDGCITFIPLLPGLNLSMSVRSMTFTEEDNTFVTGMWEGGNTRKVEKQKTGGLHGKDRYIVTRCVSSGLLWSRCQRWYWIGKSFMEEGEGRGEESIQTSKFATCGRREGKQESQTARRFWERFGKTDGWCTSQSHWQFLRWACLCAPGVLSDWLEAAHGKHRWDANELVDPRWAAEPSESCGPATRDVSMF